MYYCCQGCKNCCNNCGNCCSKCCECCDQCISGCCSCCGDCCNECCKCIQDCFKRPFSFCTFLSFFVTFAPFVLMIVGIIVSIKLECVEKIKIHLIIQGICNLINFIFCIYLMCQYSKGYTGKGKEGSDEKNVFQRTLNLFLYDWVVCIYIILLIFFIAWVIVGHIWYSNEPQSSECRLSNNGFLMTCHLVNLIVMDVYLIVGGITFLLTLFIIACEEGSCDCCDLFRCCILCITCGCCDPGKFTDKNKKPQSFREQNNMQQARENRQQYSQARQGWLQKSKILLQNFGLFGPSSDNQNASYNQQQAQQNIQNQQYYQNNQQAIQIQNQNNQLPQNQYTYAQANNNYQMQNVNNPNQIQYNPYNQGALYVQQQYQYPPQEINQPQQQSQQQGIIGKIKGFFGKF